MDMLKIVSAGIYNAELFIKNKTVTKNRKTTLFEIELPIGTGGMSYIDNDSRRICDSFIICAKPGQMRHTKLPFKCHFIHLVVKEGQLCDILSSLPNYIDFSDGSELKEIFTSISEHYALGTPEDDIMLQSLTLRLIYLIDKYSKFSKTSYTQKNNNQKIIESTLEYIGANLTADLSLETLADRAKFSPVYFHKLFKASVGKKLHRYIEDQRIKKSIELLISTDMTLTEIAYECGFSSQSYFNYAFKRNKGLSPRAYARKIVDMYDTE